ncbi:hypothetical protein FRC12_002127 [Ceratobasidium sp. 428]|nr:hypothetical protein FRC12_002127 [Ceratobasidium sp. 428]
MARITCITLIFNAPRAISHSITASNRSLREPETLLTSLLTPDLLALFILSRHSGRRTAENSSSLCRTPDVEFAETDFHTLGVFGFDIGYHVSLVGYRGIDLALRSTLFKIYRSGGPLPAPPPRLLAQHLCFFRGLMLFSPSFFSSSSIQTSS